MNIRAKWSAMQDEAATKHRDCFKTGSVQNSVEWAVRIQTDLGYLPKRNGEYIFLGRYHTSETIDIVQLALDVYRTFEEMDREHELSAEH